ncbi:MAG: outer membrane beta-barrel protein [Neisseriaceae bacterium]
MKKFSLFLLSLCCSLAFADASGIYLGGGVGYGSQDLSISGTSASFGTPAFRVVTGYQFASWLDAEVGYTYISQANNWNNLGSPSTTVYDLAFLPGFTLPIMPLTIYARLGVDGVSANLNSNLFNQMFSNLQGNFEWGAGLKLDIPGTKTFVRGEYINFGAVPNNNNDKISVLPSVVMITAGYVF